MVDLLGRLVQRVQPEQPDKREPLVLTVLMVQRGQLVQRERLAALDLLDQQAQRVEQARPDLQEPLAEQVRLARLAQPEQMAAEWLA